VDFDRTVSGGVAVHSCEKRQIATLCYEHDYKARLDLIETVVFEQVFVVDIILTLCDVAFFGGFFYLYRRNKRHVKPDEEFPSDVAPKP